MRKICPLILRHKETKNYSINEQTRCKKLQKTSPSVLKLEQDYW